MSRRVRRVLEVLLPVDGLGVRHLSLDAVWTGKTEHYFHQLQVLVGQGRGGGASSRAMAICPNELGSSPGMYLTFTVKDCSIHIC